ncbi:MAG: hypothetical protein ACLQNE_15510, partial [Thermoguttaceae bacterium]
MGDGSKPGVRRKKLHHIEYVHDNPLRRGLVSRAPSFPGSAWERTAGEAPPPAPGSAFEGMQAEPAGIAFPGRTWGRGA